MFPTTVWTTIREAGADDERALERFAESYRAPVLRYLARRGWAASDAEDVCQDVFVRLLAGRVLARADARRGRFRGLLLAIVRGAVADRARRRGESRSGSAAFVAESSDALDPAASDPDFDREWVLELTERALARLRAEESPYHAVLRGHLAGERQDRNRLWIARRKLLALVRHEVALTCSSADELREELEHLARFLEPCEKNGEIV